MTNVTHKFLSMCLLLSLYMFRAHRAHHQERQIVSIQSLVNVTLCWGPCRVQIGSELIRYVVCLATSPQPLQAPQPNIWQNYAKQTRTSDLDLRQESSASVCERSVKHST